MLRLTVFCFVLCLSHWVKAAPLLPLTEEKVSSISVEEVAAKLPKAIKKRLKALSVMESRELEEILSKVSVGERLFLPFQGVTSGQVEVSFDYVLEKYKQALSEGLLQVNSKTGEYEPVLENGTVLFGEDHCGTGVVIGDQVYLNDGNTKAMAALLAGASRFCVEIKGVFRNQSLADPVFRAKMIAEGYFFPWDDEGRELVEFPGWSEIKDHPGRTFLVKHRIKVKAQFQGENGLVIRIKGDESDFQHAVFLKINNDVPYLELKLWIAAIQEMSRDEILSLQDNEADISRLISAIRSGISKGHPALKGLQSVHLIESYGDLKTTADVEKAVQLRIFEKCNHLLL